MKTIKLSWITLSLLFAVSFSSCIFNDDDGPGFINCEEGEGDVVTETISMNYFKGIELDIDAQVYLTQGEDLVVEVEGESNVIDLLELDIQDDIWQIEFENCIRNYDELKIYIQMPEVEYLGVCGSGKIYSENDLETDEMELKISGSGDIDIAFTADKMDGKISGSGEMKLAGEIDEMDFKITGSGDIHAFDLTTNKCEIEINGSGDAELYVVDDLDIKITGSGDVRYKGNPSVSANITGSGDIEDAN